MVSVTYAVLAIGITLNLPPESIEDFISFSILVPGVSTLLGVNSLCYLPVIINELGRGKTAVENFLFRNLVFGV